MCLPLPKPNRLLTVAIATVAVVLFADGGTATASCGDYLTISGRTSAAAEMPAGEHSPKAPCHGPNCSATPIPHDLPLTAPLTKSLASDRQLATVNGGWQPTSAAPPRAWQLVSDCGTVSRPSVPFHPPKSV